MICFWQLATFFSPSRVSFSSIFLASRYSMALSASSSRMTFPLSRSISAASALALVSATNRDPLSAISSPANNTSASGFPPSAVPFLLHGDKQLGVPCSLLHHVQVSWTERESPSGTSCAAPRSRCLGGLVRPFPVLVYSGSAPQICGAPRLRVVNFFSKLFMPGLRTARRSWGTGGSGARIRRAHAVHVRAAAVCYHHARARRARPDVGRHWRRLVVVVVVVAAVGGPVVESSRPIGADMPKRARARAQMQHGSWSTARQHPRTRARGRMAPVVVVVRVEVRAAAQATAAHRGRPQLYIGSARTFFCAVISASTRSTVNVSMACTRRRSSAESANADEQVGPWKRRDGARRFFGLGGIFSDFRVVVGVLCKDAPRLGRAGLHRPLAHGLSDTLETRVHDGPVVFFLDGSELFDCPAQSGPRLPEMSSKKRFLAAFESPI